jgi:hypothetical protein
MKHNLLVSAVTALIPLIVGSAWYSPIFFLKPWLAATGLTPQAPGRQMAVNMALLYVFSFLLSIGLAPIVIHQFGLFSLLADPQGKAMLNDPNSDLHKLVAELWRNHGHMFRRYRHGAFHGALTAVFIALPLIASGAVFEKRGIKYILITWGYWLVNLILMGAVICHWSYVEWPK